MGRRKIIIRPILDQKLRNTTFNKRKNGLIKKAAELSMLCDLKLLLLFEDTSGSLIQYSTHNIFNQFQYFQNHIEEKVLQFTPQDYPNFFKVNHYKKSKIEEKNEEKDQVRLEKQQNISMLKMKAKNGQNDSNEHNSGSDKMMPEPMKNESMDTYATRDSDRMDTPEMYTQESKKKNIKNLHIKIPEKHQMNNLKQQSNLFFNIASNPKIQSPQLQISNILSPFKNGSPLLSKNGQKILPTSGFAKSSKQNEVANMFSLDSFMFNPNYDQVRTPDLPAFFDPQSATSHQMSVQQQRQQNNHQISLPILPQTQLNNEDRNNQMLGSLAQNLNNNSYYKTNSIFEADSPYSRQPMNQKLYYPFMNNTNEEGFSPFLKNNVMLELNNNPGSSVVRQEKTTYFTFKPENNFGVSAKNYDNNNSYLVDQNMNMQQRIHKQNGGCEDDKLRPKKKFKI